MQLQQIVPFGRVSRTSSPAEDVAEPLGGDDERVVERFQMGGDQPVGLVVVDHEGLQGRRGAGRGGPEEADLVLLLHDARPHLDLFHSITRLLPESATASRSPRSESP